MASQLKSLGRSAYWNLYALISRFESEAKRCAKIRAYYAACVLEGAVLEAMLIAICDCYIDDVRSHIATLPSAERPRGQLTNWSLDQLIKIAVGLHWLPARTANRARRKIGDWVELVRETRNLVHPGKHLREYPRLRLRKGHYADCYEIVRAVVSHLEDKVHASLRAELGI